MNNIIVHNARQNNLKNVSLQLPKNKITVFTGVSGSGKSSLVFDTIGAEAQRQLNETYDSFIRHRLQHYAQPEADKLDNLNVAIIINQKRLGGNARSTVGTATDTYSLLRLLFSRAGTPFTGYSNMFSFNHPQGMCPRCEGLGKVTTIHVEKLIDRQKSLNEGAVRFPSFTPGSWRWKRYVHSGYFDNDKKLAHYTAKEWDLLLYAAEHKPAHPSREWGKTMLYEGVIPRIERSFLKRESKEYERHRLLLQEIITRQVCPDCGGARLNKKVLACTINGKNIAECAAMQVDALAAFMENIRLKSVATITAELQKKLAHLTETGLGYLSLDRETASLSGGESQRIKMVKHLGSSLTGLLYIFDEPSTGLHPADVARLNRQLVQLRDKGNTILIVEHDPDVVAIADHVVDIGPGAGIHGGEIVYEGSLAGLHRSKGLTARYFHTAHKVNMQPRQATGFLLIRQASLHNLKNVSVQIPQGVLTVVTGVAGSGKSTLINQLLPQFYPEVKRIDQAPLHGSRRSHLASYSGIFDTIRQLFAQKHGVSPGLFSTNSEGACPECKGLGKIVLDLAFLEAVEEQCEACGGSGYRPEVLQYQWKNKNIQQVLQLTVEEAARFFTGEIQVVLQKIHRLGLGYITLGQPLSSFSGGERQRLKLATELDDTSGVFVFDEPTTGLHPSDTAILLEILNGLVDKGNTVIVIEHNLDVISQADWLIDLGPGAGSQGGKILFEGTVTEMMRCATSLTGRFLAAYAQNAHMRSNT